MEALPLMPVRAAVLEGPMTTQEILDVDQR